MFWSEQWGKHTFLYCYDNVDTKNHGKKNHLSIQSCINLYRGTIKIVTMSVGASGKVGFGRSMLVLNKH